MHSPYAAQLCYPARELQKVDFVKDIFKDLKFKNKSLDERMRVEQRYQQLAADNPVASALNFDFVLRNYMENLLGLHLDAKGAARCCPDKSLREPPKGLCGRLHAGLFVKETNKRGCLHGHGTTKGGLTPALLAHCCDDPDLARACVRAIESQVSASLPVEYHAVAVAQDVLNVAKRKDTGVPIPDFGEEFPHDDHVTCLEHHGMRDPASTLEALSIRIASTVWRVFWLTLANKNVHVLGRQPPCRHEPTCALYKSGTDGCRFRCPWGHDVNETSVNELKPRSTSAAPEHPRGGAPDGIRCRLCYGVWRDFDVGLEDGKRHITYEVAKPSPTPVAEPVDEAGFKRIRDERALSVDLARPLLGFVADSVGAPHHPLEFRLDAKKTDYFCKAQAELFDRLFGREPEDPDLEGVAATRLQEMLSKCLEDGQRLHAVLQRDGLERLRERLKDLCDADVRDESAFDPEEAAINAILADPAIVTREQKIERIRGLECTSTLKTKGIQAVYGRLAALQPRARELRRLWVGLAGPRFYCQNGTVAEHSLHAEACLGGNTNHSNLGAGVNASAAEIYTAKYSIKDCVGLNAMASVLLEANERVTQFPSKAEDADTDPLRRKAKHFAQYVTNHTFAELDAVQAASVVLGIGSSEATEEFKYISIRDALALAGAAQQPNPHRKRINIGPEPAPAPAPAPADGDDDGGEGSLLDAFAMPEGTKTHASVYEKPVLNADGEPTAEITHEAVPDAEIYGWRDHRLEGLNALEFRRWFRVRKATAHEREQLEEWRAYREEPTTTGGERFYEIRGGCPLSDTHVIVETSRGGIVAFAGRPPPRIWAGKAFFEYYCAAFVPWIIPDSGELPTPTRSHEEEFTAFVADLEDDARLHQPLEEEEHRAGDDRHLHHVNVTAARKIAAGRLFEIQNLDEGFRDIAYGACKRHTDHLRRARDLWEDVGRPRTKGRGEVDEARTKRQLKKVRDDIDRKLESTVGMLKKADNYADVVKDLRDSHPGLAPSSTAAARSRAPVEARAEFAAAFEAASRRGPGPTEMAARGPSPDEVRARLKENHDAAAPLRWDAMDQTPDGGEGGGSDPAEAFDGIPLPDALRMRSPAEVRAAMDEWVRQGKRGSPPLNGDQQPVAAELYRIVKFRNAALRRGRSAAGIDEDLSAAGRTGAVLLVGAGGTGKSTVIDKLKEIFANEGLGTIVVTAFTGVAASVFGAPTLLTLFGQGIEDKATKPLADLSPEYVLKVKGKFKKHAGVDPEDVALLVIDEVSFNDDATFGHVENCMRALTDGLRTTRGGMPLLLAGDNMQKPPPSQQPWYKRLVEGRLQPAESSSFRGMSLLKSARRFTLRTIMRSADDEEFSNAQKAMRDPEVAHPVTSEFFKRIRKLSSSDVDDPRWRFAPIGVTSQIERDYLNVAQIRAFAEYFELPLIKWRKPLPHMPVTEDLSEDEIDELYENEPNLWHYFVEGAPGLMTEALNSTRALANGTPFLFDSLHYTDELPENLHQAYEQRGFVEVALATGDEPEAVYVRVGSTRDANGRPKHFWHGIPLQDMSRHLVPTGRPVRDDEADPQLVPLVLGSTTSKHDSPRIHSAFSAHHKMADRLRVKEFPYMLCFAMTDYKLQGRTLPRLVVNIIRRGRWGPSMDLPGFYVLISRAISFKALRWLRLDSVEANRLRGLRWDEYLIAWNNGYDRHGVWSDTLARNALREERLRRETTPTGRTRPTPRARAGAPRAPPRTPRAPPAPTSARRHTASRRSASPARGATRMDVDRVDVPGIPGHSIHPGSFGPPPGDDAGWSHVLVPLIFCSIGEVPASLSRGRRLESRREQLARASTWWAERISLWAEWCREIGHVLRRDGVDRLRRAASGGTIPAVPGYREDYGVVPYISRAQQEQLCKDANIDGPILMCLDAYSSATTHDVSAAPAPRPPEAMNMSDEEFDGAP